MGKILLTGAYRYSTSQIALIESLGYKAVILEDETARLDCDLSEVVGVVCNRLFQYHSYKLFKDLEFVQLTSAGTDQVPVEDLQKVGIQLFTAKGVYSIPVAEWTISKILEIYKASRSFYDNQKCKRWEKNRSLLEITDKKVAIIGFGDVGVEIAKRLKAFGAIVWAFDVKVIDSPYVDCAFGMDALTTGLVQADIVILSVALNEQTIGLMNRSKLMTMKDEAVLINIARGPVIDEAALIDLLKAGKFFGVALDVFQHEPLGDSELWSFSNVLISPHNAYVSDKVHERFINLLMDRLESMKKEKS